jgi:hypothetical protein
VKEMGVDEPRNSSAIRKGSQKLKCGYCMKLGHNKRSCVASRDKLKEDHVPDNTIEIQEELTEIWTWYDCSLIC